MSPDSKSPRPMRTDSPVSLWEDVSRELWEVQLLGGASRLMSNDEIDAALATGELGPRTLVRRHGASAWATLRELRGLEPSALAPAPPPATASEAAPMAMEVVALPPSRRPPPLPLAVQNRPVAPRSDVAPLSTEELAVARPNSPLGKIIAVAAVALAFGGIFAAMSARFSGTHARAPEPTAATTATTTVTQAATQAVPPPPALQPVMASATTARAAPVALAGSNTTPATTSALAPKPTPEAAATAARALAAAGAQAAPSPPAPSPPPPLAAMARSSVVGAQRAPAPAPASSIAQPAPVRARTTPAKHETTPKKIAAAPSKKSAKTVEARKAAPAKKGTTAHPRHRAAHLKAPPTPARTRATATPKPDARRTNRK